MRGDSSVVVTGSSGAIGNAISGELTSRGWHVVGLDVNERPEGGVGRHVIGDVADPASHAAAARAATAIAPLRGWVNCAGFNILGDVATLDIEDLRRGVDVNLVGVFLGCAEAVRNFLELPADDRGSCVVNISSIQAATGFRGFAAYAMCKGGIDALTRQVAAEYAGQGIRSNAVAPGLIAGPMNEELLANSDNPDALRRSWRALTPIGRIGQPIDIASAVAFLIDEDQAGFVTGEVLQVNGGALTLARGE